ncbi:MAG: hypothetical protein Q7J38_03415 [Gallionella sp.]|nr:hypothetical protein [Gallionella sp.]
MIIQDKREFTAKIKKGWSDASIYFRDKMDNGLGFVGGLEYQNRDSYTFSKMIKGAVAVNNLPDKNAYPYFLLPGRNVTAEVNFTF